ncbi:MAG: nucleotidyltransferase [Clostridiales bacterium]|nr:nucleotidyltransferase [Clostridiales bacterium]
MKEPVLVIMAAGMGSRYGGLKQIDPVGSNGEIIMDFSLYDAYMAGFTEAIFIIKESMKDDISKILENGVGKHMKISYAFQKLGDLPDGYEVPEGREKPWGTCHAVRAARELIHGNFAVINADDYYGSTAFSLAYDFLANAPSENEFCMIGYNIENTLSENGSVARGVCEVSSDMYLKKIDERTQICRLESGDIAYTQNDEKTWEKIEVGTPVSMNFWGFTEKMLDEIEKGFPKFLDKALLENPQKGEYFLPLLIEELLQKNEISVKVLNSKDKWHGVTYKEDREAVVAALQALKDAGFYPEKLWK